MFDSTLLAAVSSELQPLVGVRLRDIWLGESGDNESRTLYLAFAGATLVIDTHPQRARLHLTHNMARPAPMPTPFGEAARRALRGARLTGKTQPNFDRILHLQFSSRDNIGNLQSWTLIAELMDRRSNVILLDENGIIVDALKRLPPFLNRARTILPHRLYEPPPGSLQSPLEIENWHDVLAQANSPSEISAQAHLPDAISSDLSSPNAIPAHSNSTDAAPDFIAFLRARFAGISPFVAKFLQGEIARGVSPEEACAQFFARARRAAEGDFSPVLCGAQPYPFALGDSCIPASQTLSELIEAQVATQAKSQGLIAARATLLSHLARRDKRIAAQRADAEKAARLATEAETFKRHGQLLLSQLGEVEAAAAHGENWVELDDPWTGEIVRLKIEPNWPAADNATRLFNRYKRAQRLGENAPQRQIQFDVEEAEIAAWRERAQSAKTLEELNLVGAETGLVARGKSVSRTREQSDAARPENKLRSKDIEGWTVFMGRSAIENQLLLSKVASPSDIWMHVRASPSAHVLIKNQKGKMPPPKVLEDSALWLAHSTRAGKNAAGERVEIIYTPAKWVRSVKGSPGKVTLQRFETLDVKL